MKPTSIRPALLLLAFAACGKPSVDETPTTGQRSFDVVATLRATAGGPSSLPATNTFTLVLDPSTGHAIVGANGQAASVRYATADGRSFLLPRFSIGVPRAQCADGTTIDYDTLTITVTGSSLTGKASGMGQISCGDCQFGVPFTADVAGVADVTPPVLLSPGAPPSNLFAPFFLATSEPLPVTATAWLVASDDSHVDLVPSIIDGTPPLIIGFAKPEVVLSYNQGFALDASGLLDFAGQRGTSGIPLRFAVFLTPPLVPEDGFESATGTQVGGAAVISGGPLAPITGARSVYIGSSGAPQLGGVSAGAALQVRLAVQPGDTKLRLSFRSVSPFEGGLGGATVAVGSVGHKPAFDSLAATEGVQTPLGDRVVFVSSLTSKDVALPADVTGEVVVSIEPTTFGCGGPSPPPSGLLLDDLRLE